MRMPAALLRRAFRSAKSMCGMPLALCRSSSPGMPGSWPICARTTSSSRLRVRMKAATMSRTPQKPRKSARRMSSTGALSTCLRASAASASRTVSWASRMRMSDDACCDFSAARKRPSAHLRKKARVCSISLVNGRSGMAASALCVCLCVCPRCPLPSHGVPAAADVAPVRAPASAPARAACNFVMTSVTSPAVLLAPAAE